MVLFICPHLLFHVFWGFLGGQEEVLSDLLKGKSDTVVFCDVSNVQRELYLNVLSLPEFQLLKRAKEPCDCGRKGPPRRARCCYKIPYHYTDSDDNNRADIDISGNGHGSGNGNGNGNGYGNGNGKGKDNGKGNCNGNGNGNGSGIGTGNCGGNGYVAEGDGIDPRAILFRKFHSDGEECPKCPFCCQLAAVSKLQKIANHPCLLQVCREFLFSTCGWGRGWGGGGRRDIGECFKLVQILEHTFIFGGPWWFLVGHTVRLTWHGLQHNKGVCL